MILNTNNNNNDTVLLCRISGPVIWRGGGGGGERENRVYVPLNLFWGIVPPPGKFEKVKTKIVYHILTKDGNTIFGSGGPKSAAFRLIKMQKLRTIKAIPNWYMFCLMPLSHIHSGARTASKNRHFGNFRPVSGRLPSSSYGRRDSFLSRTGAVVLSRLLPILPAFLSDR